MPFYARVNNAISRANSALQQLYRYDHYAHPRSEPNNSIRNNARLTIDPTYYDLQQGVREGRYERVRSSDARQALHAANLLSNATWSLSDQHGRPADVRLAQSQIRQAVDYLYRARW